MITKFTNSSGNFWLSFIHHPSLNFHSTFKRSLKPLILSFFLLLGAGFNNYSFGQCNIEDWQALQALYQSTDGANWTNNSGWDQVDPAINPTPPAICDLGTMYGIVLDGDGRVVELNLTNNNLSGSIPSELGDLTNLTSLNLDQNNLNGSIPSSFANLSDLLQFDISDNSLSGCYDSSLKSSSNQADALEPGGTVYVRPTSGTLVVTDFDPTKDQIDVGPESIHTQIMIDGPTGLMFQNMFNQSTALILEGIFLEDLKWFNFQPILDAHFQQDISAALAYENCTGLWRPNTVYVRSHEPNLVEEVSFDPATDKVSFFYLAVRADEGVNFTVEQTPLGARFYSPYTGQSMTLLGVDFSELDGSHFEFRANQLEDNLVGRMDLDVVIPGFQIDQDNVFNGKSVPMAGGVDQAPYHEFTHPEYTGSPICVLANSALCNFSNEFISDGNSFNAPWEDFCNADIGLCEPPTISINSPANNSAFQIGTDITISATAQDGDGTITSVDMDVDGSPVASSNTSGDIYEGTWTPSATGTFTITVTVTDNDGFQATATAAVTISDTPPPPPPTGDYNYGEVLQKSLFFYEVQQSGPLSADNRVHWRGDAALGDGDGSIDLTGGWFDAGDHVKFGFPMAYSATVLAWSGVEDQTAYESIGQWDILLNNLRYVNDYFLKCHVRNGDGSTDKFYGQVGNGSADHAWWGPAEVMQMARPAYYVDAANPGSDLTGETAAALAAASMIFATEDPSYSATLLDNAIALYNFADTYRGKYSDAITDASAFYNSWSGYQDELVWGAIWLYRATGDPVWLTKAETEYAFLSTEAGTNVPSYHWTLAWDDKSYGCYALMAQLTNQQNYKDDTERWLDYWSIGYNGEQINYSPGGQAHLDTWGSLRYAANTSFVALLYADVIANSNPTKSQAYIDFATGQIDYALGSNPNDRSFVCGFGNNPPINPHHRTAHGSWSNSLGSPTDNRHILYGALVGGPSSPNDQYVDDRGDYIANEVACDYNAGFTGAIANLLGRFGGTALANFPVEEYYEVCDEYFNEAKINASGNTFTEVAVWANNHSAWPATETDQVCYRYFVDISEGLNQGYTVADYTTTINAAPGGTTVSDLILWDGTVYYAEVCFTNINIFPGGQSDSRKEAQLRIALPNNAPASAWDPTNDWSYYDNYGVALDNTLRTSTRIAFYNDGELLCGDLPAGGNQNTPPVASFTADPISGNAPLYVSFDASASYDADGDPLTYTWDLGHNHTHTGVTTSRSFTMPGVHTVTLTVDDGNGGTDTATGTITVIDPTPQPPTAVIIANPTSGGVPLIVSFDATNSTDPNADVLTYLWDFGDGNTSTSSVISHTYNAIGTYTATLTVDDGNGGSDATTVTISVTNTPPNASFTASPNFGQPPLDVTFDASASNDPNGDNLTYSWDFGDGNSGSGITTNHTYVNEGVYTTTLTVDDGNGGTDTFTSTVTVSLTTCNLELHYKTPDTNSGAATDNQVRPHFQIYNLDDASISMQDITIRYWYTKEGSEGQTAWVDYAQVGSDNVTTNFVELATPVTGADHYLEVGFTAGAGSIPSGGNSGEVQTRFAKVNWSNYDENDDHSYNMSASSFQVWDKVTLYCNGVLAWGVEPGGGTPPTNTPPVAGLVATPTSGTAPLSVAFDASSSTDADGDALTYSWSFGDGNNGTGVTANHIYTNVGTYIATMTVSDGTDSDTETVVITVTETPQPPVALINANPTSGSAPLNVDFNGSNSYDPNGDVLTYAWDFGDGNSTTGMMVSHTYTSVGTYTATLTVSDGTLTDSESVVITVSDAPQAPVALINANPTSGTAPLNIDFDGSDSYDTNGDALTYSWDFGDGNSATGAIVSYTYTNVGTYTATLTVSDGTLTDSETVVITVTDTPEPPVAQINANPTSGTAPLNVNFDGSNSYDPNGNALTYLWDFGDGNSMTGAMVSHTYTNVGTYTATLTVSDGTLTDSESVVITVSEAPQPPVALLSATPTSGTAPLNVNFDGSSSYDPNGDALTYSWDFGDGNSATGATASHIYTSAGSYTATLTVSDGTLTDSESVVITVTSGGGGSCAVTLKYKTPDNTSSTAVDNQVRPHFMVENSGTSAINLQDITIRYWYTKEGTGSQNVWVDYAQVGSGNITTNFVELATPVSGADHYLEVGFTAGAGSIAPGGSSGEVQTRFAKTNWSNYDENDDYSYNMNHSSFIVWDKVTVYCNGNLAWGTEPDGTGGGGNTNNPPVAFATANPTSGTVPLDVQFDASGSSDADGDALSYTWDFGDGNSATGSNPMHTYTSVGTYTATLTVSDGNGGTDTEDLSITVNSAGGGDIEVIFTVNNSWGSGYCASVEIINNGSTTINGWTLDFVLNANINNLWNAIWSNAGGNNYTASNLSWNANIPAGGSRTFGYCASHSGSLDAPTDGVFNGSPVPLTFINNNAAPFGGNEIPVALTGKLVIQPNVTRDQTLLKYELPTEGPIRLMLFDQTGRLVRTITEATQSKGIHSITMQTNDLTGGMYFVRLEASDYSITERLIVVK